TAQHEAKSHEVRVCSGRREVPRIYANTKRYRSKPRQVCSHLEHEESHMFERGLTVEWQTGRFIKVLGRVCIEVAALVRYLEKEKTVPMDNRV
ncbi:hypothetical protein PIB30_110913, partial [Stylosanthes scabra]|nr:hypothetical protein [Stylosanthes scabra]